MLSVSPVGFRGADEMQDAGLGGNGPVAVVAQPLPVPMRVQLGPFVAQGQVDQRLIVMVKRTHGAVGFKDPVEEAAGIEGVGVDQEDTAVHIGTAAHVAVFELEQGFVDVHPLLQIAHPAEGMGAEVDPCEIPEGAVDDRGIGVDVKDALVGIAKGFRQPEPEIGGQGQVADLEAVGRHFVLEIEVHGNDPLVLKRLGDVEGGEATDQDVEIALGVECRGAGRTIERGRQHGVIDTVDQRGLVPGAGRGREHRQASVVALRYRRGAGRAMEFRGSFRARHCRGRASVLSEAQTYVSEGARRYGDRLHCQRYQPRGFWPQGA